MERPAHDRGRPARAERLVGVVGHATDDRSARPAGAVAVLPAHVRRAGSADRAGPAVRDVRRGAPHPSQRATSSATTCWRPAGRATRNRLRYDTHDVTALLAGGDNVLGAVVADGWWRGFLEVGHAAQRLRRAARPAGAARDHLRRRHDRRDRDRRPVAHDDRPVPRRRPLPGRDLRRPARTRRLGPTAASTTPTWEPVEPFEPAVGALVAPPGPPVRRIEELRRARGAHDARRVRPSSTSARTSSGASASRSTARRARSITLRHAEVLEHGEPAYRPLRNAEATDHYTLRGDGPETWEPTFTFHGFRYVEVRRLAGRTRPRRLRRRRVALRHGAHRDVLVRQRTAQPAPLERRVGHARQLPRRADRLPATRRTARLDRRPPGVRPDRGVPLRRQRHDRQLARRPPRRTTRRRHRADLHPVGGRGVPDAHRRLERRRDRRARGTAHGATATPDCWPRMFDAMRAWVDCIAAEAGTERIWNQGTQLGDWLDPNAPPDAPMLGRTDSKLVATGVFRAVGADRERRCRRVGPGRPAGDLCANWQPRFARRSGSST